MLSSLFKKGSNTDTTLNSSIGNLISNPGDELKDNSMGNSIDNSIDDNLIDITHVDLSETSLLEGDNSREVLKKPKRPYFKIVTIILLVLILLSLLTLVGVCIYYGNLIYTKINEKEVAISESIDEIYGSTEGLIQFAKNARLVINTTLDYFPSAIDEIFGSPNNVIKFGNQTKIVIEDACYLIPKCRKLYE
jgi:hypothetical protein